MTSPPPPQESESKEEGSAEQPQAQPQAQAQPSQAGPSTRSIFSYWGGGNSAGPSESTVPPPAKKKRRKAEQGPGQARLALGSHNGSGSGNGWAIKKSEVQNGSKGKSRQVDGEDQEMKEMVRRAKSSNEGGSEPRVKRAPGRKRVKGRTVGGEGGQGGAAGGGGVDQPIVRDSSDIGGPSSPVSTISNTSSQAQVSPTKRSRAQNPLKVSSTYTSSLHSPTKPEIVDLLSSGPPHPLSPENTTRNKVSKNKGSSTSHPFFGRTASSSSKGKGAVHDPIDIEEEPQKRAVKKRVFASDLKPAHPLFARVAEALPLRSGSVVSDTPTEATIKSTTSAAPKSSKTHTFFSIGGKDVPGKVKNGWGGGVKEGEERRPLWPGGDFPSREPVAGPSTPPPSFARRQVPRVIQTDEVSDNAFWNGLLVSHSIANIPNGIHSSTPHSCQAPSQIPFIQDHPAISSTRRPATADRETWCERYRPTKASQVLGNELEATYLRDWLRKLSVGGNDEQTGRRIVRKVRRAKTQLVEGWIVDDAGLFGDPYEADGGEEEEEEYIEYEEPHLPLGHRPHTYPSLGASQLTNTILLTGPPGSGKSAAVYAAATELDWEVFEVYPGMGKRAGGNLMSWVGDVGRNHLVLKGGKGGKEEKVEEKKSVKGAIKSFFGNMKKTNGSNDKVELPASQGSASEPIDIDDNEPYERDERNGHDTDDKETIVSGAQVAGAVRQSLILIDEADILFAEENTFWPAVISLIADSHRPVILTCNDPTRIPIQQLPLQTILHFHSPPSHLAIPYLETIAHREGVHHPNCGVELYQKASHSAPLTIDQPLPPNGNEPLPYFDLRLAINQLQLDRKAELTEEHGITCSSKSDDIAAAWKQLDTQSYADAYIAPGPWAVIEISEIDRHEATPDDEIGLHALVKPDIHDLRPVLAAYDRAPDIVREILRLAGGPVETLGDLQTARINHVRTLLPLLDPLVPLTAPLLPSASLFVDVMPVLQMIIEADDMHEIMEDAAVARGEFRKDRKTGRPKRSTRGAEERYERYIELENEALQAARASVLQW